MANAAQERVVSFRPRTVLVVLGILLATLALLSLVYLAWHIITWILIAVFLALALDPAVEFFERRGLRRGYATGIVFVLAIGVIAGLGFLLVPPLVDQVRSFVDYVPQVIDDVTAGRGPFGFLQTEYHIVDRVREAIDKQGAGGSSTAGDWSSVSTTSCRTGAAPAGGASGQRSTAPSEAT